MKKIIIDQENSGQRIDRFLKEEFFCNEEITRGEIIRLIKDEKILVNAKSVKPSYILKEDDQIEIEEIKKAKELKMNQNIKFQIVFENKDIIIIEKPTGLKVHPDNFEETDTLANGLLARFPELKSVGENSLRPGIVHRLDKDTSGLMVVARNQKSFKILKEKFGNREVEKKYLALVWGRLEEKKGTIDKSIARATNYKKQVIAEGKTKTKIRRAVTQYEVVKSFKDFDLVEATPKTGRMHQIRVHFFSLGHPLVGDRKYSLKKFPNSEKFSHHLLHAKSLAFNLFEKDYSFESEIPQGFKDVIELSK